MDRFFRGLSAVIDAVVRVVVLPVASIIPLLVRTGALFALFLALWAALLIALAVDPARLDAAWSVLAALPLPLQALAWLLFLPLTGALWTWSTDWPVVARVVVILAICAWNLVVFLPRRTPAATPTTA
jgi:hypothetical protein